MICTLNTFTVYKIIVLQGSKWAKQKKTISIIHRLLPSSPNISHICEKRERAWHARFRGVEYYKCVWNFEHGNMWNSNSMQMDSHGINTDYGCFHCIYLSVCMYRWERTISFCKKFQNIHLYLTYTCVCVCVSLCVFRNGMRTKNSRVFYKLKVDYILYLCWFPYSMRSIYIHGGMWVAYILNYASLRSHFIWKSTSNILTIQLGYRVSSCEYRPEYFWLEQPLRTILVSFYFWFLFSVFVFVPIILHIKCQYISYVYIDYN